ncbi:MAG: hypothetical protein K0R66_1641 [Gammaproteobacteria bacterium]|jgi:hypothetical protein|nr:hypothetical protein [Gammaproteobacteria bacterium]
MTTPFERLVNNARKAYDLAAKRTEKQIAVLDEKAAAIRAELAQASSATPFASVGAKGRGTDSAYGLGNK